jgi:hypothetical protein
MLGLKKLDSRVKMIVEGHGGSVEKMEILAIILIVVLLILLVIVNLGGS